MGKLRVSCQKTYTPDTTKPVLGTGLKDYNIKSMSYAVRCSCNTSDSCADDGDSRPLERVV